ncbi:MAG: hypothetical protein GQ574_27890 [Crocinitomix sp.]|nr:hypothetical protein [Crocinitomix sp.]
MDFKVGVFADGQLSGEALNETKRVLQEVALKYKCRFELNIAANEEPQEGQIEGTAKSNFKPKFNDKTKSNNGDVFLSFGGEIEA